MPGAIEIQPISEFHPDIIKAVSSLPAASAANAGQRRFRTSDNITFKSDGTRWLSTQIHTAYGVAYNTQPFAAGVTQALNAPLANFNRGSGTYTGEVLINFYPTVAQSAANYYAFHLYFMKTDGTSVSYNIGNTQSCTTANRWYTLTFATNYTNDQTYSQVQILTPANGSPGTWYGNSAVIYRLIG